MKRHDCDKFTKINTKLKQIKKIRPLLDFYTKIKTNEMI